MTTDHSSAPAPSIRPRICPQCGLIVAADQTVCECGYAFGSQSSAGGSEPVASKRLRDAVDLFSAKEALAIAFHAVQELKGSIVRWMAIIGLFQVLPVALTSGLESNGGRAGLFLSMVLSMWVTLCLQRAALARLREEPTTMSRIVLGPAMFGSVLLAYIVMAVPVFIGTLLFIAPGIYLMLTWSQVSFLIMDGRAKHVDALRASEELTRDRRMELLVVTAVPVLLSFAAVPLVGAGPLGGSVATPQFVLFLVGTIWQTLAATFGAFASAAAYQMLLNSKKHS